MGAIPLILATGAGAESRTVLGIVVFSGVSLATLLTLFVVPSFYALLGAAHGIPQGRWLGRSSGCPAAPFRSGGGIGRTALRCRAASRP